MTKTCSDTIREINKSWNDQMLKILQDSPVESGGLKICFDKSPNIFLISELKSEDYKCIGFFMDNRLIGFAMLISYNAYVNGSPEIVMYLCNMYIKKEGRGKQFYFRASDIFYKNTYKNSTLGYTLIMKGNKPAESYIGKRDCNYKYLPYSKSIANLMVKNLLITFKKKENSKFNIRQANESDIKQIVNILCEDFQKRLFAPVMNEMIFRKNLASKPGFDISNYYLAENNGQIIGVCSVWDTQPIKQNRVIKYSIKLKIIRIFYTILSFFFGFPPLPKEGEACKDATVVEYAVRDRNPEIMAALLRKIYNVYRNQKYNMIIFGTCHNDPLIKATDSFLSITITSHIVLASKEEGLLAQSKIDISLPYVDVAMM
jgi:hypothetical protein